MHKTLDIIIPTYNNYQYLFGTITSLLSNRSSEVPFHIIIVNNGHEESCNAFKNHPMITVYDARENLGWEGGINFGLSKSTSEFVLMCNDDIHIPFSSTYWSNYMLNMFRDPTVGGVGPTSNVVMGKQNIFALEKYRYFQVTYLIGFFAMYRRSALETVKTSDGYKTEYLDESLSGGDDFDISIRIRKAGYKLLVENSVFILHHGFKTGTRLRGDSNVVGGWNSFEHYQNTNTALIKKHGLKTWYETIVNNIQSFQGEQISDSEGKHIQAMLENVTNNKVYELGCGATKTVDHAIGVDMIPKGEMIATINAVSVADVVADVSQELPFKKANVIIARHVLEHCLNTVETLLHWKKALAQKGLLIVAVPNQDLLNSIPLNPEHVHAFNPSSLTAIMQLAGFMVEDVVDPQNGISFIIKARKP